MNLPQFRKIDIETYRPGRSNLNKIKNIIKLSANESALGVGKNVRKVINGKIDFHNYFM